MSNLFKPDNYIVAAPEILLQEVDDACVILNLRNQSYYGLDAVGYDFYKTLLSGLSIKSALDHLFETYEIDRETLQQDMFALLENLLNSGIIEIKAD